HGLQGGPVDGADEGPVRILYDLVVADRARVALHDLERVDVELDLFRSGGRRLVGGFFVSARGARERDQPRRQASGEAPRECERPVAWSGALSHLSAKD